AWSADHPDTPIAKQVSVHELVAKLSMAGKIFQADVRVHPFVAFDPAREVAANLQVTDQPYTPFGDARAFKVGDAYACGQPLPDPAAATPRTGTSARPPLAGRGAIHLVRHAVERAGFLGVKVYPPVGFAPMDNIRYNPSPGFGAKLDLALHAFYSY